MTKLLKISALSAFTLLFAACDPEMIGADVEERALFGEMLDIADSDGDDDGFEILDDLADATPAPAPMVEYDLDLAAEDEDPCDTWGPEGDLHLDSDVDGAGESPSDDDQPPIVNPDEEDDGWGDLDLDNGDDGDNGDNSAGESPSDDDQPPIINPDDDNDGWGDLDLDSGDNSGAGESPSDDDQPPITNPDDDNDGWGDLDLDGGGDDDGDGDGEDDDGN